MRVDRQGVGSAISSRSSTHASGSTVVATKPSRRKSCEHPSCPKQPAFSCVEVARKLFSSSADTTGYTLISASFLEHLSACTVYNGSGVRFCAQHRLKGMVNVRNRRCEGISCTKEPYFGERGGKARFCASHKPNEEMVDVRHRRCEFVSCHKQPNYGYEGQRACFCSTHKLPTMVDVKHRRCAEAGCRGYSSFAFPGSKEKFCAAHRLEGMMPSGRGRGAAAAAAAAPSALKNTSSTNQRPPTTTISSPEAPKPTPASWESGPRLPRIVTGIASDGREVGEGERVNEERRESRGSISSQHRHLQTHTEGLRNAEIMKVVGGEDEQDGDHRRIRRSSELEHDMDVDTSSMRPLMRRRSGTADFVSPTSSPSSLYAAHGHGSPHHGVPGMPVSGMPSLVDSSPLRSMRSAGEQQQRPRSSDIAIRYHCISSPRQRPASWASWSSAGAYGGGGGGSWPRAPLACDIKATSFSSTREDAGSARKAEIGDGDSGSSSQGDGGSVSSDDTRGGYPAPRFSSGSAAGGGSAVQMRCFAAGGPTGGSDGAGMALSKSPVSRCIGGCRDGSPAPSWAESALVSRQLPNMGGPAVSQDTAVAGAVHSSPRREGLPKLDSLLAGVGFYQWSSFVPRRKADGTAWPRPDVVRESSSRARIPIGGESSRSSGGSSCAHDGVGGRRVEAFVPKPSTSTTSRVFTLTGPQKRLVKYDQGAGPLGPTLETLEPRWRAGKIPVPYA